MSMSNPGTRDTGRRTPLGRRNILLLGAALLVLGYCVLFPVGIAL